MMLSFAFTSFDENCLFYPLEEKNQGAQSRPEKIVTLVALLSVFILLY